MQKQVRRIAILVDTSTGWGRRVIRGVANYALKQGGWQITVEERGINEPMALPAGWHGDGVIVRLNTLKLHKELSKLGIPAVNVSGIELRGVDLPRVTSDYNSIAELAVSHFMQRGFLHLAYCGLENLAYVERHRRAFENAAKDRGMSCHCYQPPTKAKSTSWQQRRGALVKWLEALPKPVGILTWASTRARNVLNACLEGGIMVPEQVAVLAGDDDELLCETTTPPLSAIVTPAEQIGHEAAKLLHRMMDGDPPSRGEVLLRADELNSRGSTDTLAIKDQAIAVAIRHIRENIQSPSLQVADIAALAGISRRALERRFHKLFGYGPAHEIQSTRCQLVRKLLRETDLSIADLAARSGYASQEYMIRAFKKDAGTTPLKYRKQVRGR